MAALILEGIMRLPAIVVRAITPGIIVLCLAAHDGAEDEVAELKRLGARIERDTSRPGQPVVKVVLVGSSLTDKGLKELASLYRLSELTLIRNKMECASDRVFGLPKSIKVLKVIGQPITQHRLEGITSVKDLE